MLQKNLNDLVVSTEVKDAMENYVNHNLHPGAYVQSLIDNDLRSAVFNAHPLELPHIKDALCFVDMVLNLMGNDS